MWPDTDYFECIWNGAHIPSQRHTRAACYVILDNRTKTEYNRTMSIQSAEKARDAAREAYLEAERRLAETKARRILEPAPGGAVQIKAVFPRSSKEYRYLAFRTENAGWSEWYVTGEDDPITWDRLLARVERATFTLEELTFVH
jgi:hypothetical protein